MNFFNFLGSVASILGAIFALMAWIKASRVEKGLQDEKVRQSKKITVALQHGADKIELPIELTRAELTRAEVLGRIGMIPMQKVGSRFELKYTNTPEFLKQINNIMRNAEEDILTIPCSEDEIKQFNLF